MNVVLPLRAEPSPAALHMGHFCCAKGAGLRQLDKGGGSCKLRAADLCNGQKKGPGVDLHPRDSYPHAAATSIAAGTVSANATFLL